MQRSCLGCGRLIQSGSRCGSCRRQRHTAAYGGDWRRARAALAGIDRCARCGERGSPANPLTADHVVPVARGGTDDASNLQVLCRRCNSSKADR
ncbi:HNH endonuclease signature motif containing protein [Haloactinopolyspora sp.]|uniref:HNH endonuclease n=1 Tax=Haloactinopolyspora sp. TaxID=1966353 RepID=UPI00344808D2